MHRGYLIWGKMEGSTPNGWRSPLSFCH